MSKPSLSISVSNNSLTKDIQNIDGVAAMIGTGMTAENQSKIFVIYNLQEAVQAGITQIAEPYAYKHIKEFYTELGGNQQLFILLLPNTVTMAQMLDYANTNYANKLVQATGGKISLLGVFRQPAPNYTAGSAYFDADVAAAVTASKTFVQNQNTKMKFLRVLIEGRISNESSTTIYTPSTASNGYAGVVVGGTANDKSASIGLALGRKIKYAAHIKMGKVANGALTVDKIYVGTKELNDEGTLTIPAVSEVRASATLTITNVGTNGDWMWVYAITPNNGWIWIGNYQKQSGDTTTTAVATALQASINSNTTSTGYSATRNGAEITIVSPAGLGATNNGLAIYPDKAGGATFEWSKTAFANGVTAKAAQVFSNDTLHDKGFISFLNYPGKAGYFFGVDSMATDDDFKILAHGCVVDACAKIVASVYIEELESEVDTNADGTIKEIDAVHLEDRIKQQVLTTMGERISGFDAFVDRTVNIIETSKTKVKMKVLPKGYNTYIEVELGLTSGN